jgi:7-cyano-7-deazaguanine synthase
MDRQAIVLLSGGIDSATALAIARDEGFRCNALSFSYGQRHSSELDAARRVAAALGVERQVVVDIDLRRFGGSALTGDIEVPKGRDLEAEGDAIPVTYVPARNTIFLSYALAFAETSGASDIFIGVNALDYSGYPDCRPEYIAAFQHMANLATKVGVEGTAAIAVRAPLITMTKAEIIRCGTALGVDYGMTVSCYDADIAGRACRRCDSCQLRARGFAEAGVADPTTYQPVHA